MTNLFFGWILGIITFSVINLYPFNTYSLPEGEPISFKVEVLRDKDANISCFYGSYHFSSKAHIYHDVVRELDYGDKELGMSKHAYIMAQFEIGGEWYPYKYCSYDTYEDKLNEFLKNGF